MIKQVFRIALKDFQIQLRSILYYLIAGFALIVVFLIIDLAQKEMVYSIVIFAVLFGFVNKALYDDEKNNTLGFLTSLPVKRDVIVYGRYLSTGVLIIALSLLIWLFTLILGAIALDHTDPATPIMVVSLIMAFTIMLSVYLPLAFKFGYIKAAGINRFVFLGLFALIGGMSVAFAGVMNSKKGFVVPQKLDSLDATLTSINPMVIVGCIALFTLIIYLVSMRTSIKLFRKRVLF